MPGKRFDIVGFIERLDEAMCDQLNQNLLDVVDDCEVPLSHGATSTQTGTLIIPESTYEDARKHGLEGRFTMAHELGHSLLNHRESILLRQNPDVVVPPDMCVEQQADSFACELLLDIDYVLSKRKNYSKIELSQRFGIPFKKLDEHFYRLSENQDFPETQLELDLR